MQQPGQRQRADADPLARQEVAPAETACVSRVGRTHRASRLRVTSIDIKERVRAQQRLAERGPGALVGGGLDDLRVGSGGEVGLLAGDERQGVGHLLGGSGSRPRASRQASDTRAVGSEPASVASRSANASEHSSMNVLFISNKDCGATVDDARCSQLGAIKGASNVSRTPSGRLRRTCT